MKSKSLTFRIFINTFLVGTLVYFVCAFMFFGNLYTHFEQQIFNELESESIFLEDRNPDERRNRSKNHYGLFKINIR